MNEQNVIGKKEKKEGKLTKKKYKKKTKKKVKVKKSKKIVESIMK